VAAAKSGYGANMLALATESGAVQIVDTDITADAGESPISNIDFTSSPDIHSAPHAANQRGYYTPHVNAIFDVKWSPDDSKIVRRGSCTQLTMRLWVLIGALSLESSLFPGTKALPYTMLQVLPNEPLFKVTVAQSRLARGMILVSAAFLHSRKGRSAS
jgi:hypothetical protein